MPLSSDFRELVRSRTDIVSLISESLTLVPRGAHFAALCPFHDDHNPSMFVYPDRQSFRCWSCNTGGDAYTWVMKRENVSFPEALEILANRAHVELPKRSERDAESQTRKSDLHAVLKWAELQFHEYFLKSPAAQVARDYVQKRGYSEDTIKRFGIGYAPEEWDWLLRRAQKQFSPAQLLDARLIGQKDGSASYYDFFRDRIMFPIRDERSRTVAFGGRVIPGRGDETSGKYVNSRDSLVFQKGRNLYGLVEARESISEHKSVVVVEGYADCVACHQYGVRNVVAQLGTALTETQCDRLRAFARTIVLAYDADEAGQRAAARAVGMLLGQSVDLRVLTIPQAKDPDEFLKLHGTEAFQQLIQSAPEAWEFRLNWEIKQKGDDSIHGREQILTEMLALLAKVPRLEGTPREAVILTRLASRLRLAESELRAQLQRQRGQVQPTRIPRNTQETTSAPKTIDLHHRKLTKDEKLECELLEVLLIRPELAQLARQEVGPEDVQHPELRRVLQLIYDLLELGEEPSFERVTLQIEDNELKGLLVWIAEQARVKQIEQKLVDTVDGVPGFLQQNLKHLVWRREEKSHQDYQNREAMRPSGGSEDALARLKKASMFHQKRATNQR